MSAQVQIYECKHGDRQLDAESNSRRRRPDQLTDRGEVAKAKQGDGVDQPTDKPGKPAREQIAL